MRGEQLARREASTCDEFKDGHAKRHPPKRALDDELLEEVVKDERCEDASRANRTVDPGRGGDEAAQAKDGAPLVMGLAISHRVATNESDGDHENRCGEHGEEHPPLRSTCCAFWLFSCSVVVKFVFCWQQMLTAERFGTVRAIVVPHKNFLVRS